MENEVVSMLGSVVCRKRESENGDEIIVLRVG